VYYLRPAQRFRRGASEGLNPVGATNVAVQENALVLVWTAPQAREGAHCDMDRSASSSRCGVTTVGRPVCDPSLLVPTDIALW
jgi:hypothetical protein